MQANQRAENSYFVFICSNQLSNSAQNCFNTFSNLFQWRFKHHIVFMWIRSFSLVIQFNKKSILSHFSVYLQHECHSFFLFPHPVCQPSFIVLSTVVILDWFAFSQVSNESIKYVYRFLQLVFHLYKHIFCSVLIVLFVLVTMGVCTFVPNTIFNFFKVHSKLFRNVFGRLFKDFPDISYSVHESFSTLFKVIIVVRTSIF